MFAICPRCYRSETIGTIACYSCGVTLTNSPITAEQVHELAADSCSQLLNSLGLVANTTAEDRLPYRGKKSAKPKSWEERCKGWLRGSLKKKDPETGRFKYTSIVDRWEKDPAFRTSCNEESQKQLGNYFTLEDAYEADELAAHEKILGEQRKVDNAMPSKERQTKFVEPEVRSAQSGGSGTRPRIGTEAEQRAVEALKGREK